MPVEVSSLETVVQVETKAPSETPKLHELKSCVLVVGSANADVYVEIGECSVCLCVRARLSQGGETERLPLPGETIAASESSGKVLTGGKVWLLNVPPLSHTDACQNLLGCKPSCSRGFVGS